MDPADLIHDYFRSQAETLEDPIPALVNLRSALVNNQDKSCTGKVDVTSLDEWIDIDRRLFRLYDPTGPDFVSMCDELGDKHYERFFMSLSKADLSRACYFKRLTVELLSSCKGQAMPRHVAVTASIVLAEAAQQRLSEALFGEALGLARLAITTSDEYDVDENVFLQNLGEILEKRFACHPSGDHLKEMIKIYEHLAGAACATDESDRVWRLFQLSRALFSRWELYRQPEDLKRATTTMDYILEELQVSDDGMRHILSYYGVQLFRVYRYHPHIKYVDRMDELFEKANEIPTNNLEYRLSLLISRGQSFSIRAERSNNVNSATAAFQVYEEGLRLCPKSSEIHKILLNNWINSSIRICTQTDATKATVKDHLDRIEARLVDVGSLDDSGILLQSARMQHLHYRQDPENTSALEIANTRVIKALLIDDFGKGPMKTLAIPILNAYYSFTKVQSAFEAAYSLISTVWASPTESPYIKIQVARDAASLLHDAGRVEEAWDYLRKAVEIIIVACPRDVPRDDQRFIISILSGLSNDACAVGIPAGVDISEVLQVLERGRGLAISMSHSANEDLLPLSPDLLELLGQFEDSKSKVFFSSLASTSIVADRFGDQVWLGTDSIGRADQDELARLSEQVQKLPDLRKILDPVVPSSFQFLASEGPIVVVNSSTYRNDVILITEARTWTFRLDHKSPLLVERYGGYATAEKVARRVLELISRGDDGRTKGIWKRNALLGGHLMWLWDYVVNRVCEELNLPFMPDSPSNVKRIWWLPTGFFTQMPFHAAGNLACGVERELMANRAISSYISSFRMLKWARSRSKSLVCDVIEGMIVTMAAPKQRRLPSKTIFVRTAQQEADTIQDVSKSISWTRTDRPGVGEVMDALPHKNVMHFCCHGESDRYEPARSHLKLFKQVADADDDPQNVDTLTAGCLSSAVSQQAILAILSACYTTEIRELSHLDEGLQIGNAFQIAGFPHVIGSLWAASDVICPKWSRQFYSTLEALLAQAPLSNMHIAMAYHNAVIEVLNEDSDLAILWAPFVHFGP